MVIDKEIELLKNKLAKKFGAKQIIVFGSRAYGNSDQESDIDLCVVTELKNKRKIDLIREIRQELVDLISSPLDILVYSEKEFNERAGLKNTF
ncbi:nucleotidyltransferase domain-containing protein [candidate division KSB1 bacterium]|nr:nucleotidyltransferase domain-containing protein [candidate division KSB1 bacterium]NIR69085.1 nucleotidyltransferase domain-containing protein [candidate division KSB1 bacterium]NIS27365.1 nucleotidyltransferase domain-containing protein [candidate division KSB1 bacterium]NIT73931.1 nucleotidyltransferase domain-containing protein [candidate division KSB1 bacterium]NIU28080.1 nucleotidyltransferase domain-containing protein [candidate division KSB1 bacterium]